MLQYDPEYRILLGPLFKTVFLKQFITPKLYFDSLYIDSMVEYASLNV
jgi:hypothetical protein